VRNDPKGFTLFEVIVSITLTGFLMVALLIGLRVANRAWRTGEARFRQVHAEAERKAFIVEQIASLVPYQAVSSDPSQPGTFTILQASPECLRFVTTYSSIMRSRSGLLLAEYGIVEASPGDVEVLLRETPVGDNAVLLHRLIRGVKVDPETGVPVIDYQPFLIREGDLPVMTDVRDAWFEYLDIHPRENKGASPLWRRSWQSTDQAPYPEAIRLRWDRGTQAEEEVIPVRAKLIPPTPVEGAEN